MDDFRDFHKFWVAAVILWVLSAILGLGLVGAVIWGIVKLVTHFT